jgi:hypothetical protein
MVPEAGTIRRMTVTQQLQNRKAQLETDLQRVEQLIAMLKANPETQTILDLLTETNIR